MSRSASDGIWEGFTEEVKSYLPTMRHGIQSFRENPDQKKVLEEVYRLAHTIKGAAALMGVHGLSHIAYQLEEAVEDLISGELTFSEDTFQTMSRAIEQIETYCQGPLQEGLDEQAMLRETILAFRRTRDLPPEEDEEALRPLLESITGHGDDASGPDKGALTDTRQRVEVTEPYPEVMDDFYQEADEHLEDMGRFLNILEPQVAEPVTISTSLRETISQLRRSVHTLKGAAAVVGLEEIATWAHEMEDLLDWLYDEAQELTSETISVLIDATDLLARLVSRPHDAHASTAEIIKGRFVDIMGQVSSTKMPIAEVEPLIDMEQLVESVEQIEEAVPEISTQEVEGHKPRAVSALHTRTLRVNMHRVDDLVNLVGEIIIALSGFDQKMDIFIDSVSEIDSSRVRLREAARNLEVGYEVKAIQALGHSVTSATASGGAPLGGAEFSDFDALELDRYSEFNLIIRTLSEAVVDVGAIGTQLANVYSDFDGYLTRLRVLLSELQDKLMSIRMIPMANITNRMHRTVREVAGSLGKKVRVIVTGEEIELDRVIWEKLTDPLMHLLRNAVDHGIEHEALRQAMEKPPVGTVQVDASREGNQVVIRIIDDGAGLNFEAIRRSVLTKGLSDRADELSEDALLSFIFQPGFSTRHDISDVSGRGVGLDVVEQNIQDLKGTIRAASWRDKGTQFTIRIPLTLAAVRALLFNVGERTFAIPLNEIREIIRVEQNSIRNEPETTVAIGDEILPLHYTARILDAGNGDSEAGITSEYPLVLLVEAGGQRGALVVDTLVGQREIVIKSLGSHLRYVKGISGVTIMGDGSVVAILNAEELLATEIALPEASIPDPGPMLERPLKILVVDDSVSIRQVVSRLMETQGWKTQTAKDGIEALERVSEIDPDLIVLDLEMPRMNGYEFMSALRSQPRYREIPVVILTSRTAEKHRQKAKSLGAEGFIVKPYDDDEFINLVQSLTGRNLQ